MPAFLVTLPDGGGKTLIQGSNAMVVFADDAAGAKEVAANHFDGDPNALWLSGESTAVEVTAGAVLPSNYEFFIQLTGAAGLTASASFRAQGGVGNVAVQSGVINAQGTGYVVDDILTAVGGTFTRAATFRVTAATVGVIDTIEMVDPGEYTVAPSLTANAVTGGTGASATVDITMAAEESYEVLMGQMVTLLNANVDIAGAAVDFSEGALGARLLTIATGGGGDDLGDGTVVARIGAPPSGEISGLLSTVTHQGVATAVLSIAIPAVATLTFPGVTAALKS
jgi:hypothetical protein